MFISVKQLTEEENDICFKTLSSKAVFALVGNAIKKKKGISIVRIGDGEVGLLDAPDGKPFTGFNNLDPNWNTRLGIEGLGIEKVKANILEAGNACTYFAPSVSGISLGEFKLHHRFNKREVYLDNFFVADWTKEMIRMLLVASEGVQVIHKDCETLIENFVRRYDLPKTLFSGFKKKSWRDNEAAIKAAIDSGKQLVLFSAGPAGKIIGPKIALAGKGVLDVGKTLPGWSIGDPRMVGGIN